MTTKIKIIVGFVLMIALLAGTAIFSYFELQQSDNGFQEYRRNARVNVVASDIVSALFSATSDTFEFISTGEVAIADRGEQSAGRLIELAKTGENETAMPERITAFRNLQQAGENLRREQQAVRTASLSLRNQYEQTVRPALIQMRELFMALADNADRYDNTRVLYALAQAFEDYNTVTNSLSRLSETARGEDAKAAVDRLGNLEQNLGKMGALLHTDEGKGIYSKILELYKTVVQATTAMAQNAAVMATASDGIRKAERDVAAMANDINDAADAGMRAVGAQVLEVNATAQRMMLIMTAVGLLVGAALALFIIVGIVRVLGEMSHFASAIANGSFSYEVKSKEKGEIGMMVASMKRIPQTLSKLITDCNGLANSIKTGQLRTRGDVTTLPGNFADLGSAINGISDAYTQIVDAMPMPVMTCTKDNKILFLNKVGQAVAGGEHVGAGCGGILKAPECNSDKCVGNACMARKGTVNAEVTIHPQGKAMIVAVTAQPLTDLSGNTAGFLEIINDLTEIRGQQRTMMQVADQASEISNRVAAASEELSAQVEQVSRGAEMQRTRMESTASAMTEMNATVLEVARSAGQASEQTDTTRQKAEQGAGLVKKVSEAINSVNAIGQQLRVNMEELGKQAESIGGVMGVISDIADQTNLLALNAAIEAARAGEAGRGFAVVADEVRKLAEKTMEATQEVGSSINSVQHAARLNVDEVGKVVASVEQATTLANSSGEALSEIVQLAAANSSIVASIATAAEEQSATSEEINHAIDEVNRVVGETAEGMIQSSAAVQDLSQMAQELRRVMEGLK